MLEILDVMKEYETTYARDRFYTIIISQCQTSMSKYELYKKELDLRLACTKSRTISRRRSNSASRETGFLFWAHLTFFCFCKPPNNSIQWIHRYRKKWDADTVVQDTTLTTCNSWKYWSNPTNGVTTTAGSKTKTKFQMQIEVLWTKSSSTQSTQ